MVKIVQGLKTFETPAYKELYERYLNNANENRGMPPINFSGNLLIGSSVVDPLDNPTEKGIATSKANLKNMEMRTNFSIEKMRARREANRKTQEEENNKATELVTQDIFNEIFNARLNLEEKSLQKDVDEAVEVYDLKEKSKEFPVLKNEIKVQEFKKNVNASDKIAAEYNNDRAGKYFKVLKQEFPFLNNKQLSALVGNLHHESKGFTKYKEEGVKIGGRGDAQWTGTRRTEFLEFCKEKGLDPKTFEGSSAFFIHELKNNTTHGFTKDFLEEFNNPNLTLQELSKKIQDHFFRPGKKTQHTEDRFIDTSYYYKILEGIKEDKNETVEKAKPPLTRPSSSFFNRRGDT